MRPKPTWHGFVRWTRLGFIGGPVFCILAAVLLIVDVKDVAGWGFRGHRSCGHFPELRHGSADIATHAFTNLRVTLIPPI